MPTPSNTPSPSRLGMYNNPKNSNRPRIKIHIPPPNLSQHNYPSFGAASPFINTAHSNPSMQFSGAAPQWPSSPYPYVPDKGGLFKQFDGFKAWDWTKSGLNKGEKSVFFAYAKLSRWSKRWFTHFFLTTIVFLYSVIGAYTFVAIEGKYMTFTGNLLTKFGIEIMFCFSCVCVCLCVLSKQEPNKRT